MKISVALESTSAHTKKNPVVLVVLRVIERCKEISQISRVLIFGYGDCFFFYLKYLANGTE